MKRFCQEPGCSAVAQDGKFCPTHAKDNYQARRREQADKQRTNAETRRWYKLAAWTSPKYGLRVWKLMQTPMCEAIDDDGQPCRKRATDVHHVDDTWREGRPGAWSLFMTRENLMSLCHEHHSEITAKEAFK